jgi:hypothetical protein
MKNPKCERCPDEHTRRCDTCDPNKPKNYDEITIERAIEYFEEENERYENMLGYRANQVEDYRINQLVIKALKQATL